MSKSSTATVDHHTNLLNINYIIIDKIISNQTNPKPKSSTETQLMLLELVVVVVGNWMSNNW